MLVGAEVVPLDGGVDWDADAEGVAGFDLLAEEIGLEVWVLALGVLLAMVVHPAMVAAGETGDGVDSCILQGLGEFVGVERVAYIGEMFAGMEIEVDLSVCSFGTRHCDDPLTAGRKLRDTQNVPESWAVLFAPKRILSQNTCIWWAVSDIVKYSRFRSFLVCRLILYRKLLELWILLPLRS